MVLFSEIKSDRESLKDYGYGVPYSGIFTKINAVEAFTDTNDVRYNNSLDRAL